MKHHIYITPEGSINWIEKMPRTTDYRRAGKKYEEAIKLAKAESIPFSDLDSAYIRGRIIIQNHIIIHPNGLNVTPKLNEGLYPLELDADIQKVKVFERASQTPENLNRDNPIAGYMKFVARIIPKKAELISERNWDEDFEHENGKYHCLCTKCDRTFLGHKRRSVCKICSQKAEESGLSADELNALSSIGVVAKNWYAVSYSSNSMPYAIFDNKECAEAYRDKFSATSIVEPWPMVIKDLRKKFEIKRKPL